MKKLLSLLLSLVLLLSMASGVAARAEEPGTSPAIQKPVYITIVDELEEPVSGASVQVLDAAGKVVDSWTSAQEAHTAFLPEGEYTLRLTAVPEGYAIDRAETGITVTLAEAERRDDFVGECFYDHSHPDVCSVATHIGLETYAVHDAEGSVTAFCFNQNYDNPDAGSRYRRLVGTPELLYSLAQNKSDEITPQELYDHVLAIIYHSQELGEEYGLDDVMTRYLTNMALKNYTDPTCFNTYDDDGNSMLARDEDGRPIRDENGNYVFNPGGTVLGSMVHHAAMDNGGADFPLDYREVYQELISYSDHPEDYYLYIYYPEDFQPGNTDSYQCLMSVFQVEPVRATLSVRTSMTVEITKQWNDGENQDGLRPDADTFAESITLLADGKDVTRDYLESRTVTDQGDGSYILSFSGLPKYSDGKEIAYTLREKEIPGYTADKTEAAPGETITNTHKPESTRMNVMKTWDDDSDRDGLRPTEIRVTLLANGETVRTVTLSQANRWAYVFMDLPVYREGKKIEYSLKEEPVEGYEPSVRDAVITNTHAPETTRVEVSKIWDDDNNRDGIRPESVTVNLLADGQIVQTATVTAGEKGDWSYCFEDLPKYRDRGVEIVYTVSEEPVTGYTAQVEGFTITNLHEPELIELPVVKTWIDSNNKAGRRPTQITVHLFANLEEIEKVTIKPDDKGNWGYTFQNMPKYSNGKEIRYTLTEDKVAGYFTSIDGLHIRNSTTPITGDSSTPGLWLGLLGVSVLALGGIGVFFLRKRRQ